MKPDMSTSEKNEKPPAQPTEKQQVSDQPAAKAPMVASPGGPGGNKNAKDIAIGPDGVREWSSGLFDCFDDPQKRAFPPCTVFCVDSRFSFSRFGLVLPERRLCRKQTPCRTSR
jgi:hypothetical protein